MLKCSSTYCERNHHKENKIYRVRFRNIYQNGVFVNTPSNPFDICLKFFIYRNTQKFDVKILCRLVIC